MSNVPSSSRPPSRPAGQAEIRRPAPRRTSTGQFEKPKPVKAGQAPADSDGVAHLWGAGGDDMSRAEVSLKSLEEHAVQTAQEQHTESSAGKEEAHQARDEAHRKDAPAPGKPGQPAQARPSSPPQPKGPLQRQAQAQGQSLQQLARKAGSDGFQKLDAKGMALSSTSFNNLTPVGQLQNKLSGTMARGERPPDAFKLLSDARDSGVLFKEDAHRDGHSEDQEDPELAAAVEECIRLCFGVRGILRIGAGKNDAQDPIIVVVAAQGFSEGSFARVPALVHRFSTLVAIPFELLPLRRDA